MEGDTLMANNISPSYYQKGSIEVTDYITSNEMSFIEGNIIKYVTRYKDKSGIQDLRKARWYLDKLIETQMDIPMEDMK
jgi:hypothetical protein|tara:strand:+ start:1896 stop:2132 length:237 start_codon:yes stop_codon:yes gene_type:complete